MSAGKETTTPAATAAPATPPTEAAALGGDQQRDVSLRELLGKPKITFVLGKRPILNILKIFEERKVAH